MTHVFSGPMTRTHLLSEADVHAGRIVPTYAQVYMTPIPDRTRRTDVPRSTLTPPGNRERYVCTNISSIANVTVAAYKSSAISQSFVILN